MTIAKYTEQQESEKQSIKCVVWDLDNTIWNGVLAEDDDVFLKKEITEVIKEIDRRGILQSIASKNNNEIATKKLKKVGLLNYFIYPQINWNTKSSSIKNIAKLLNIGLNTFAFIDDQPFEREEVLHSIPEIMCIDSEYIDELLNHSRMMPRFITEESKIRRLLYQNDQHRKEAENHFNGPNEDFLASLNMTFEIKKADEEDLQRAEELTIRTHQLNTTGYTYSYDELYEFLSSNNHILLVAKLTDKFGTYGTIGLALVELKEENWIIKLLLMSCRVMSRGVGTILMSYMMSAAKKASAKIRAEFIPNDVNRMMLVTYRLSGFQLIEKKDDLEIYEHYLDRIQPIPSYVRLISPNEL